MSHFRNLNFNQKKKTGSYSGGVYWLAAGHVEILSVSKVERISPFFSRQSGTNPTNRNLSVRVTVISLDWIQFLYAHAHVT